MDDLQISVFALAIHCLCAALGFISGSQALIPD
jgi:hypothetical protein